MPHNACQLTRERIAIGSPTVTEIRTVEVLDRAGNILRREDVTAFSDVALKSLLHALKATHGTQNVRCTWSFRR